MARMKARQDRFAALLAAEEAAAEESKSEKQCEASCIMCRGAATDDDPLGFVA